jgi:hypothetical protein
MASALQAQGIGSEGAKPLDGANARSADGAEPAPQGVVPGKAGLNGNWATFERGVGSKNFDPAASAEARKALEAELRDARGSLKVRERVLGGAQADADQAAKAVEDADEALEAAKRAAEEARSDAESAERVLAEAKAARDEARDHVARLEERLD